MKLKKFVVLSALTALTSSTLTACALFEEQQKAPQAYYGPREQVYFATFEEVWRAANLVLQPYPLRISNMDQGTLETDLIHGFKVFCPPYKNESQGLNSAYRMTIHVIRGELEHKPATKVTLLKDTEVQSDFFSEPRALPSEGMEEKAILYRIGREIQIERALGKAQKKKNKESAGAPPAPDAPPANDPPPPTN